MHVKSLARRATLGLPSHKTAECGMRQSNLNLADRYIAVVAGCVGNWPCIVSPLILAIKQGKDFNHVQSLHLGSNCQ